MEVQFLIAHIYWEDHCSQIYVSLQSVIFIKSTKIDVHKYWWNPNIRIKILWIRWVLFSFIRTFFVKKKCICICIPEQKYAFNFTISFIRFFSFPQDHSHTPWLVIIYKFLQEWKNQVRYSSMRTHKCNKSNSREVIVLMFDLVDFSIMVHHRKIIKRKIN